MDDPSKPQSASPIVAMFEGFRSELDEHHDRRERVIKASRDITAASKKLIFSLQRVRKLNHPIPLFVVKANAQYWQTIESQYRAISSDLQRLNAYRYRSNITGGNQEFMEALSFQHYLETQSLISYEEAGHRIASMGGEGGSVLLTPEDYILGIFDMVGELMRFAITSMATSGKLPGGESRRQKHPREETSGGQDADKMELDRQVSGQDEQKPPRRDVLADLRELRLHLEGFDPPLGEKFADDVDKKIVVMRQCVEKVETALYGLVMRGQERPKGWIPDLTEQRRAPEQVEGY